MSLTTGHQAEEPEYNDGSNSQNIFLNLDGNQLYLTVDPEYAAYPVTDFSLKDDLPASVKVYSTPATNYFSIYKKDKSKIPSAGFANSIDNTFKGKTTSFYKR